MARQYEIESAGYNSFRDTQGMDPEEAADLGYATPENYRQQVASGKEVGRLLTSTTVAVENNGWKPGDDYKHGIDARSWQHQPAEQQETNRRGLENLRRSMDANRPKEQ